MNRGVKRRRKKTSGRILGLDGLRTLALLGVLLYHTFPAVVEGGYFGVILFFVISGYLAARSACAKLKNFKVLEYYKKRIIRIYPELLIVLFSVIGVMTMAAPNRLANTQQEVQSILLGYNNWWQIGASADYFTNLTNNSPFTHLWYIAILLQFELLWPILVVIYRFLRKHTGKGGAILVFSVLTVLSFLVMPYKAFFVKDVNLTALYYGTDTRIFSLLAGVTMGFLHGEGLRIRLSSRSVRPALKIILGFVITIVLYLTVPGTNIWVYRVGMALYTILACLMVGAVGRKNSKVGKALDNPITKWISRYSYEIYLWQYPVLFIFGILRMSKTWYWYCLQIAVILILSVWLHTFNEFIISKKRTSRSR